MEGCAAAVVCLIDAESDHLMKVIKGNRLVALGRNMQTVETMLVLGHEVATLVNEHLANLDVSIE